LNESPRLIGAVFEQGDFSRHRFYPGGARLAEQLTQLHQIAERFAMFAASGGGDQLAQFGDGVGVAIENVALPIDGFVVCGFGFVVCGFTQILSVRLLSLLFVSIIRRSDSGIGWDILSRNDCGKNQQIKNPHEYTGTNMPVVVNLCPGMERMNQQRCLPHLTTARRKFDCDNNI